MIPVPPVLIGIAVGYVAYRFLAPSTEKEKGDEQIRSDDCDSGSGDFASKQSPASNEDYRESVTLGLPNSNPQKESENEVSTDGKTVPDLRSNQSGSDFSGEQLPDSKGSGESETE